MAGTARCPTCKAVAKKDGNKVFPFCCERCQLVDLGRWLNEDYRVPAESGESASHAGGGHGSGERPPGDDSESS
jgi:endogenous inhibitor of DNA gyrase (YacG/DUF329 family)